MTKRKNPSILYVSTYPPRECGIATFTEDLVRAIDREFSPGVSSFILAMNDNETSIYNYPRKVIMQINDVDMDHYLKRASEINQMGHIKLVNIQLEYGIFGGEWGTYVLPFIEILKKPVVLTMHTVLPRPDKACKRITQCAAEKVAGIVVMTATSARLLHEVYGVDKKKIFIIPHGVHSIPFPSKHKAKKKLSLEGHTVFSTFGMLNRDKGIEYAIQALPKVIEQCPDALYLVIGATHPVVSRNEGEGYRNKLERLVKKLKLENHVKFYNKYVSLEELIDFLKATDIYLSPTLNPRQAVSGTISYAMACACPIVGTATQYNLDVVNQERGILTGFKKPLELEKGLLDILADKKMRKEMGKNAYFYSRHMTWQNVAMNYFKTFNNYAKIMPREKGKIPPINLGHIKSLTDDFGMIQFANHTKPDIHSGYALDDNVRALLAMVNIYQKKKSQTALDLIAKYLKFTRFCQKKDGKFYNFVSYHRSFNDMTESEDSFGRAIWALGHTASASHLPDELRQESNTMLSLAVKWCDSLVSLRAISFAILGLTAYYGCSDCPENKRLVKDDIKEMIKRLADKLVEAYDREQSMIAAEPSEGSKDWNWFENGLTYSNFKLPEALLKAYTATREKRYLQLAEKTLKFLSVVTLSHDYFQPIGQDGWYFRGGKRAYFDQQPEDAASATEALVAAYKATGTAHYKDEAKTAFEWFLGKNHLSQMIYDESTGGCYDGLGKDSINFNQGAESTLSYLLARLAIEKL